MRIVAFVVSLLAMIVVAPPARAWNETGHMIVAQIAYRQLDEGQKQQIAAILRTHPHYQLYLTAKVPAGVNEDEWAFMRASTWPDFVRPASSSDRNYKDPSVTRFHHGDWHYVTIPFVPERDKEFFSTTAPAAKAAGAPSTKPATLPMKPQPNILTALDESMKQLADSGAKPEDRAVSLCWALHLIGDIHQPLHAASLFSAGFPTGDKGGNDIAIRADGGVIKLHSYWDELLGTSDAYTAIDFVATELCIDPTCDPAQSAVQKRHDLQFVGG